MYKAVLKYTKGPLVRERIPSTRAQVMLPFGVQGKFKGIGKRPRFLMGEKTEEFFARNAIAMYKLPDKERKSFEVKYNVINLPNPCWVDPNTRNLELALLAKANKIRGVIKTRLKGKQKPPCHI